MLRWSLLWSTGMVVSSMAELYQCSCNDVVTWGGWERRVYSESVQKEQSVDAGGGRVEQDAAGKKRSQSAAPLPLSVWRWVASVLGFSPDELRESPRKKTSNVEIK